MTTIACFGDSLVEGYPYGQAASWVAEVERQTALTMLNYGACGETTVDIMYRLVNWHPASKVHYVLYQGGMNDILQGIPLAATLKTLHYAQYWCQQQKQQLCLVVPWLSSDTKLNKQINALRAALAEAFGSTEIFLLDLQPALLGQPTAQLFLDGVHPMGLTYKQLGQYAAPILADWVQRC